MNCQTLIITPFSAEAKLLLSVLPNCHRTESSLWEFEFGHLSVLNQAGEKHIEDYLRENTEKLALYGRIVLFGAAGGLDPDIKAGDVFFCDTFCKNDFPDITINGHYNMSQIGSLNIARQITVSEPVISNDDRMRLFARTSALIADMESYGFVQFCIKEKLEFMVIRFVSDTFDFPFRLPFKEEIKAGIIRYKKSILPLLG